MRIHPRHSNPTHMSREEMLRFFKQWSNEDRNVAANVATMLGLIELLEAQPAGDSISRATSSRTTPTPKTTATPCPSTRARSRFPPDYAPTGALPCEGNWTGDQRLVLHPAEPPSGRPGPHQH